MIYNEYKAKVAKIARFFAMVRRFRVIILSVVATLLGLTVTLLATSGIVSDDVACPPEITYGEKLRYEADAFLSSVYYEFYNPETGKWTTEVPKTPGEYKVRAVSKGAFGSRREGKVHAFTIQPKPLVVTTVETELEYAATPTATGELLEGETLTCEEFIYTGLDTAEVQVEPKADSVVVYDKNGEDITHCYAVQTEATDLQFIKRKVTLTLADQSRVYDGTPFAYAIETPSELITEGSLGFDDELVATFPETVTYVSEVKDITAELTVYNADGVDVTAYYEFTTNFGTLSILKRDLRIKTGSDSKVYDGKALTNDTIVEKDGLPDGHTITVGKLATITDVGTRNNEIEVSIYETGKTDAEKNLNENFNITFEYGTLEVYQKEVLFVSEDGEHTYNGDAFSHKVFALYEENGYKYDLASGEKAEPIDGEWASITEKGETENLFKVRIVNEAGKDTSANYVIRYTYGTLKVNAATLSFTSDSDEKIYDGTPLKKQSYTILSGALGTGDSIRLDSSVELVDVGEIANEITYTIIDADGNDKGENYEVSVEYGTLTVNKMQISVKVKDAEKIYDATELTSDTVETVETLPENHAIFGKPVGSQTNVGASDNLLEQETVSILFGEKDATANFEIIEITNGKLTVNARPVYVTTHDCEWIYDGTIHKDGDGAGTTYAYGADDLTVGEKDGVTYYTLVEGHTLVVAESNGVETVKESGTLNAVAFFVYAGETGVTDNYDIIVEETGVLTILPRPLSVRSLSAEKVYDGTPLERNEYEIFGDTSLAQDQRLALTYTANALDYNEENYKNTFEATIYDETDAPVTENYEITCEYGTLTITKRDILVRTYGETKMYDGYPLTHEHWVIENVLPLPFALPSNHIPSFVFTGTQTNVGTSDNTCEVTIYRDEEDVTFNFTITYEYGILEVTKRPIKLVTHDHEWIFDGMTHGCGIDCPYGDSTQDVVYIDEEKGFYPLADNEKLVALTFTEIENASTKQNIVTFGVEKNGEVTTENYEIVETIYGKLTVHKREVTVKTHSHEWIYDGKAHGDDGEDCENGGYSNAEVISEYGFVDGHTVSVSKVNAFVTNVADGEVENNIELSVSHAEKGDQTNNYDISYEYGTIRILPRPITVQTHDHEWIYDGNEHADDCEYQNTDIISEYQLVDGHTLVTIEKTFVRDVKDTKDIKNNNEIIFAVYNANGEEEKENYDISYAYGTLTINPRPIKVQTHDHEWIYDGESHADDCEYTNEDIISEYKLVDGHTLVTIEKTFVRDVKDTKDIEKNNVIVFTVMSENGNETDNYDVSYECGALRILPRPITVKTHTHEKTYDGYELSCSACVYGEESVVLGELVTGQWLEISKVHAIVNVKDSGLNLTEFGVWASDGEKTDNYTISYEHGTLTITKRTVMLVTHDHEWIFDGKAHGCGIDCIDGDSTQDVVYVDERSGYYSLADNENLVALTFTEIENASTKQNIVTFGMEKNGEDTTENYEIVETIYGKLTIHRREVTVKTHSHEWIYDGKTHSDNGEDCELGYGNWDVISEYDFVDGHTASVSKVNAFVTNVADGEVKNDIELSVSHSVKGDQTNNYNISYEYGTIRILPRPITVQTHDHEWDYDGENHTDDCEYQNGDIINEYKLVDGHTLVTIETTFVRDVWDTKENNNEIIFAVYNANGEEEKENYEISYKYGTLTILPREILAFSGGNVKVYDGEPCTNDTYRLEAWPPRYTFVLPDGHYTEAVFTGSQTDVGESPNYFELFVFRGDGEPVDANFAFTYMQGILRVTPRPIQILRHTHEKTYDGYELSCSACVYGEESVIVNEEYYPLVAGQRLEISKVHAIVNVKDSGENLTEFGVWSDDGEKTGNYAISYIDGTFTITKRTIKLVTHDHEWIFDGKTHGCGIDCIDGDSTQDVVYVDERSGYYSLADDEYLVALTFTEIENASTKQNVVTFKVEKNGEDTTENYEIVETIYGKLTIHRREVTVKTHSHEWIYDGKTHSDNGEDCELGYGNWDVIEGDGFVKGHIISVSKVNAFVTNVADGEVENDIELSVSHSVKGDQSNNYDISYEYGTIRILPRPITVQTHNHEWIYDGENHTDEHEYTNEDIINEYKLVDGHTLVTIETTFVRDVWDTKEGNNQIIFAVYNANGEEEKENYEISYKYGTLTITPRPITAYSEGGERMYDGTPFTKKIYGLNVDEPLTFVLPDGHYTEAVFTGSQTDVGESPNYFELFVFRGDGEPVNDNFAITYVEGVLKVTPRPIQILRHTHEKTYDGYELSCSACEYGEESVIVNEEYYPLVAGQRLEISKVHAIVNVKDSGLNLTEFGVWSDDGEKTKNYAISYIDGTFTIEKRTIKLVTHSHEWVYDGEMHGCSIDCEYGDCTQGVVQVDENAGFYPLADNEMLVGVGFTLVQDFGEKDNVVDFMIGKDGEETTDNYDVTREYGTLTILKRQIVVQTHSHEWIYDGKAHYDYAEDCENGGYYDAKLVGEYGLLDGHELRVVAVNASVTNVTDGIVKNDITLAVYDGAVIDENYEIFYEYGTLRILKREITIAAESASKLYDGTPLIVEKNKILVVSETLPVEGHQVFATTWGVTRTDAGVTENKIEGNSAVILDENGEVVTANYFVNYENGIVEVFKRPIKVRLQSYTWDYDGKEHVDERDYSESDLLILADTYYPLANGQKMIVSERRAIINVWESDTRNDWIKISVMQGDADVTKNYEIEYETALHTIVPLQLRINTRNLSWLYDGNAHYDGDDSYIYTGKDAFVGEIDGVVYRAPVQGHALAIVQDTATAYVKNVADSGKENTVVFAIYDENGKSMLDNYVITENKGKLSVLPRLISITTHDLAWNYDGKSHSEKEKEPNAYTAQDLFVGEKDGVKYYSLVENHTLEILQATSIKNVEDSGVANEIRFGVLDEKYGNATGNYTIELGKKGVLTINPLSITVAAKSASYVYDGKAHAIQAGEFVIVSEQKPLKGHTLSVSTLGVNAGDTGKYTHEIVVGSAVVQAGKEVTTGNYAFEYQNGVLEITKRPIRFVGKDYSFIYNGQAGSDNYAYGGKDLFTGLKDGTSYYPLADGHELRVIDRATATNVTKGGIENTIIIDIYDANGVKVTNHYDVDYVYGKLTVLPRPILVATKDVSFVYDGTAHGDEHSYGANSLQLGVYDGVEYFGLVSGHKLSKLDAKRITFVAENGKNEVKFDVVDGNGVSVIGNYALTLNYGDLTVLPRPIKVKTHTHEFTYTYQKQYDTCIYTASDLTADSPYKLVAGDSFVIDTRYEKYAYVKESSEGKVSNVLRLLVMRDGEKISENYEIEYVYGTLQVVRISIRVITHTIQWEYDGKEHYDDTQYGITDLDTSGEYGTLANGHRLVAYYVRARVTYVSEGKKSNYIEFRVYEGTRDVTERYLIDDPICGTIEIVPRKITIVSDSAEKVFDGTPLTAHGYTATHTPTQYTPTDIAVVETDTLTLTYTGSQTNAYVKTSDLFGRSNNTYTYTIKNALYGNDASNNYDITVRFGTLTIYKRAILVMTHSESWVYDGESHTDDKPYGAADLFVGFVDDDKQYYELLTGDTLQITGKKIYVKYVADSCKNTLKFLVNGSTEYSLNYAIDYEYGSLTITKRPIFIRTHTHEWVYDGQERYDQCEYTNEDLIVVDGQYYPLVDGEKLVTVLYTKIRDVKESTKDNVLRFDIKDDKIIVTENYDFVGFDLGKLSITPRAITVAAKSMTAEYDGLPKSIAKGEFKIVNGSLVNGHELQIATDGAYLDGSIGTTPHRISEGAQAVITHLGEVKTDNYAIAYEDGILRIAKRALYIAPKSVTKEYDGTPIVVADNEFDIKGAGLFEGHTVTMQTAGITYGEVGSLELEFTEEEIASIQILDADGNDVSGVYDVQFSNGKLVMKPRKVKIASVDDKKYYDGTPLTNPEFNQEGLLDGYTVVVDVTGSQTEIGSSANTISEYTIYDSNGVAIGGVDYYEVEVKEGLLTVELRSVSEGGSSGGGGMPSFGDSGDDKPEIYVTSSYGGETYLRVGSYGYYQLVAWSDEPQLYADGSVSALTYAGRAAQEAGVKAETITFTSSLEELPFMLPYYTDNCASSDTNDVFVSGTWTGETSVTFYPYASRDLRLNAYATEEDAYYDFVSEYYTFLPEISRTKLLEIGAEYGIEKGETTIDDIVSLVKGWFTERKILEKVYNGDYAVFFFREADGAMAKHYVTAATAMLRAYGIPARYTYGYRLETIANARMGLVPMRHAYEWTEVYIENMGWIPLDVVGPTSAYPMKGEGEGGGGFGSMTGMIDSSGSIGGDGEMEEGDGKPLFHVTASETRTLYLRQTSFGDYLMNGWDYANRYDDRTVSPLYYGGVAAKAAGVAKQTLLITSEYENGPYMIPYYTAAVDSSSKATNDVKTEYAWSGSYTLDYYSYDGRDLSIGNAYASAESVYRTYAYEYYTAIPYSTKEKMLAIGRANGIENNATILEDVANLVSNHVPYNMAFENEFKGDFAVFFFEEADGAICQHFATAATAMLRAYGIPARYVGGYVAYAKAGVAVPVTNLQAHAWVEVYIDGMGWTPLEVTGAGGIGGGDGVNPGENEGDEPSQDENKPILAVKPVDKLVAHTQTNILHHDGTIEDVSGFTFGNLLSKGYTYEAVVDGCQEGIGKSASTIVSLKIFDPSGKDVTDSYDIQFQEGVLEISEKYVVHILMAENEYEYDGTEKKYSEFDYWSATGQPQGAIVDFRIGEVQGITNAGKVSDEELKKHVTVTLDGVDITHLCEFDFTGGLSITKVDITLRAGSDKKPYDGEPLVAPDWYMTFGSLLKGHTLTVITSGSITEIGKTKNVIADYKITDESGNDVTDNYAVNCEEGTLEITD